MGERERERERKGEGVAQHIDCRFHQMCRLF